MGTAERLQSIYDQQFPADALPAPVGLPRYLAPLPEWLEDFGLRLVWPIVGINLVGTLFGIWFYAFQLSITPLPAWPFVPDSPLATLLMALSLTVWRLGDDRTLAWIHPAAFVGCLKLGAWTPFVLLWFPVEYPAGSLAALGPVGALWEYGLYGFLVVSHLAMVVQAFLVVRYARFTAGGIGIAALWYGLNDVVDYLFTPFETFTHTIVNAEPFVQTTMSYDHTVAAHGIVGTVAIACSLVALGLAIATRRAQRRRH